MSLPKIRHNVFTLPIKELKKTIKYRQFVVAEQKKIFEVRDLGMGETNDVVYDIVDSCTFNELDMDSLPAYLVDYLFLQVFIKSVENKTNSLYECHNLVMKKVKKDEPKNDDFESMFANISGNTDELPDEIKQQFADLNQEQTQDDEPTEKTDLVEDEILTECGSKINVIIPLEKAKIVYPDNFEESKVVEVDSDTKIHLKIPSGKIIGKVAEMEAEEADLELLFTSIDYVENKESGKTYPEKDFSREELKAWVENIPTDASLKLAEFFKNAPHLGLELDITCPSCGFTQHIHLKGIQSFFM